MSQFSKKNPSPSSLAIAARGEAEPRDLAGCIEAAATAVLETSVRGRYHLELDVSPGVECPISVEQIARLTKSLVGRAIANHGGPYEILITVCSFEAGFELEVADNGPHVATRSRRPCSVATTVGAQLIWHDCPQGGAAVTAVIPRSANQRMAA